MVCDDRGLRTLYLRYLLKKYVLLGSRKLRKDYLRYLLEKDVVCGGGCRVSNAAQVDGEREVVRLGWDRHVVQGRTLGGRR